MIKSELVAQIAEQFPQMQRKDLDVAVNAIFSEITKALANDSRVELRGFGAFSVKTRDARMARNPRTGDPVKVPRKKAPYFKAGKELRDRLNEGYTG
jgi:integration host factor subunit beta